MKKFLALALAILILLPLLAGCQGETPATPTPGNTGDSTTSGGDSGSGDTTAPAGGPTPVSIMTMDAPTAAEFPLDTLPVWHYIADINNVELTWETQNREALETMVNTRLAANVDLPDVMIAGVLQNPSILLYGENGTFLELDALIDQYMPWTKQMYEENPILDKTTRSANGKRYVLNTIEENQGVPTWAFFIRNDWLDPLGIPLPTNLDEVYDALVAMKANDANGNGVNDEVVFIFPNLFDYSEGSFTDAFCLPPKMNDWFVEPNGDGTVYYGWTHPNVKNYMQFWAALFAAGVVEPATIAGGAGFEDWMQAQAENRTSAVTNMSHMFNWFNANVLGAEADYVSLISMKGGSYYSGDPVVWLRVRNANDGYRWAITSAANDERLPAILGFMDFLFSPDAYMLNRFGIPGVHHNMVDGKPVFTEEAQAIIDSSSLSDLMNQNGFGWNFMPNYTIDTTEGFGTSEGWSQAEIDKITALFNKGVYMPIFDAPTTEESDREVDVGRDWETYVKETIVEFMMGRKSFDEFEDYVQKANDLGLAEFTAMYQARYDRINK